MYFMKVLRDPRSKRTALFPKFEQIFGHRLWRRELLVQVQYRKLVISKISWNVRRYNTTRQLQVPFDQLHWIMGIGFREIRNRYYWGIANHIGLGRWLQLPYRASTTIQLLDKNPWHWSGKYINYKIRLYV